MRLLLSVVRLHHGASFRLCVRGAVSRAVPQDDVRLGLQRRACGDRIGGVGGGVQRCLGSGGGVTGSGFGGEIGLRGRTGTRRSVGLWKLGRVRGHLGGGVGCRVEGHVGEGG